MPQYNTMRLYRKPPKLQNFIFHWLRVIAELNQHVPDSNSPPRNKMRRCQGGTSPAWLTFSLSRPQLGAHSLQKDPKAAVCPDPLLNVSQAQELEKKSIFCQRLPGARGMEESSDFTVAVPRAALCTKFPLFQLK